MSSNCFHFPLQSSLTLLLSCLVASASCTARNSFLHSIQSHPMDLELYKIAYPQFRNSKKGKSLKIFMMQKSQMDMKQSLDSAYCIVQEKKKRWKKNKKKEEENSFENMLSCSNKPLLPVQNQQYMKTRKSKTDSENSNPIEK